MRAIKELQQISGISDLALSHVSSGEHCTNKQMHPKKHILHVQLRKWPKMTKNGIVALAPEILLAPKLR